MRIFLDDYRVPSDVRWVRLPFTSDWTIVRDYDQFVSLLKTLDEPPEFIAFDHDLADAHYEGDFSNPDEKTGMDCAKFLVEYAMDKGWKTLPAYTVHSLNPAGRANIEAYLQSAQRHLDNA